jgi:hypothetical protein
VIKPDEQEGMMTMSQETIYRDQDATMHALHVWADDVQRFFGWPPTRDAKVPSAAEVVDHYFDFAWHVLATQRDFIKSLLTATKATYPAHGADKDHVDKDYADKDYADKS